MENKSNLYILVIVAIVAIAALVLMVLNGPSNQVPRPISVAPPDAAGQMYAVAPTQGGGGSGPNRAGINGMKFTCLLWPAGQTKYFIFSGSVSGCASYVTVFRKAEAYCTGYNAEIWDNYPGNTCYY